MRIARARAARRGCARCRCRAGGHGLHQLRQHRLSLSVLPGRHAGPRDHDPREVDRQPVPAGPRLGLRQQRHLGRPRLSRAIQLRPRRRRRRQLGTPAARSPARATATAIATATRTPHGRVEPRARDLDRQPVPAGMRLGLRQRRHLGRPRLPRRVQLRPRQRRPQRRRRDRRRHPRRARDRRGDRLVAEQIRRRRHRLHRRRRSRRPRCRPRGRSARTRPTTRTPATSCSSSSTAAGACTCATRSATSSARATCATE